nr:GspE family protein [Secundilactobacillus collinoides]
MNVYGIITRLRQLGIPEAAIHQAVTGVAYQRLLPAVDAGSTALLDLKRGPVSPEWELKTGMTPEWRQHLDDCERAGQITATTVDRFKEG